LWDKFREKLIKQINKGAKLMVELFSLCYTMLEEIISKVLEYGCN
jgi:hypothetical protein